MKKCCSILLALVLLIPAFALADTANGTVQAQTTYDITAPYSGTLLPFDLAAGDYVYKGDSLLGYDTTKIYAPQDGILVATFAEAGDNTQDVLNQYGSLCVIEKAVPYQIAATYQGAAADAEYKFVHLGETLYYELTSDKDDNGECRVIAADSKAYTLELSTGEFEQGKQVKLYRDSKRTSKSCVGTGTIGRAPETYVQGAGRIVNVLKQQGDAVKKGDTLYEAVSIDCAPDTLSTSITATAEGVLSGPKVISGQQVYKGQLLLTLNDTSNLKVVAQVDEIDLSRVSLGTTVAITFDAYPGQTVSGTVSAVSLSGITKQNAAYYDVDITYSAPFQTLLGMNATITLP